MSSRQNGMLRKESSVERTIALRRGSLTLPYYITKLYYENVALQIVAEDIVSQRCLSIV